MASKLPTETFRELARLVVLTAAEGKSAVEVHGSGCQLTYDEALTFEGTGFDPDDPDLRRNRQVARDSGTISSVDAIDG
jgi:hypothetical protein